MSEEQYRVTIAIRGPQQDALFVTGPKETADKVSQFFEDAEPHSGAILTVGDNSGGYFKVAREDMKYVLVTPVGEAE